MTFSSWVEKAKEEKRRLSSQTPKEQRTEMLQAKYSRLWRARMHKCKGGRGGGRGGREEGGPSRTLSMLQLGRSQKCTTYDLVMLDQNFWWH